MSEYSPTSVLVVTQPVAAGTPAEALADHVEVREVPGSTVIPGGVTSLADVQGQITAAELVPGEQLLTARFIAPEEVETSEFEIPEGFHQVTIQLSPHRVLGGHLTAGDTVGFFVSAPSETHPDGETHLVLHKVLVTRVTGAAVEATDEQEGSAPAETLMVTLAVAAPDAEKVVFAAEYHPIYLSLEPTDAPEDATAVVNRENVFS